MTSKLFILTLFLSIFLYVDSKIPRFLDKRELFVCAGESKSCDSLICCPFMKCEQNENGEKICKGKRCLYSGEECDINNNLCCLELHCAKDDSGKAKCKRFIEAE